MSATVKFDNSDEHEENEDDRNNDKGDVGEPTFISSQDDNFSMSDYNQFEMLCDGIVECMASVNSSMQEYLEFKDLLLNQKLPPSLLLRLLLVSGKVYRNISDLHHPLGELLRLVRIYSTPWEQKSAALKKLHDDYESKSRQLDIALKRLALHDAEAKRLAREKLLQNWEKLFGKLQVTKGHGRRWKFRMHEFYDKAESGVENLRSFYAEILAEKTMLSQKSEKDALAAENELDDEQKSASRKTKDEAGDDEQDEEEKGPWRGDVLLAELEDSDDDEDVENEEDEARNRDPVFVETADKNIGTSDLDFDDTLSLRIYKPSGLDVYAKLKCRLEFGETICKSCEFDKIKTRYKQQNDSSDEEQKRDSSSTTKTSLIGSKKQKGQVKTSEQIQKEKERQRQIKLMTFEEFKFEVPRALYSGSKVDKSFQKVSLKLLSGENDDIVAVCEIDFDEIKNLELKVKVLSTEQDECGLEADDKLKLMSRKKAIDERNELLFENLQPMNFPIFKFDLTENTVSSMEIGVFPIAMYLERMYFPMSLNKAIETLQTRLKIDVKDNNVEFESLEKTFSENIDVESPRTPVETVDAFVSPRTITPRTPKTFTTKQYEEMVADYETKITEMKELFDKKISKFAKEIAEKVVSEVESSESPLVKEAKHLSHTLAMFARETISQSLSPISSHAFKLDSAAHSTSSAGSSTAAALHKKHRPTSSHSGVLPAVIPVTDAADDAMPMPLLQDKLAPDADDPAAHEFKRGGQQNAKPTATAGNRTKKLALAPMPSNVVSFLDRLSRFQQLSQEHRQKLAESVRTSIANTIEQQLAHVFHLSTDQTILHQDNVTAALQDVCLPAVFMPPSNASGTIFNPRAHQYFHPMGAKYARLTQPPSIFQLPPITQPQISVLNLFDIGTQIHAQPPSANLLKLRQMAKSKQL